MAQFNWTYTSETGKQHVVGLFHGARTGHLIVYCNARIIQIDFHVLGSKTYTFFIDDELLELRIERRDDIFHYHFNINREADTPKNRAWKASRKRNTVKAVLMVAAMVLFVGLLGFGLSYRNSSRLESRKEQLLPREGIPSVARIRFDPGENPPRELAYSFVANGRIIEGSRQLNESDASPPMPLEPGDEFVVRYLAYKPKVHAIDFNEPTPGQIERYRQRVASYHSRLHPALPAAQLSCQLEAAFLAKGVGGFADLYFQDRDPSQNPHHNRSTYQQLLESEKYRQALRESCEAQQPNRR